MDQPHDLTIILKEASGGDREAMGRIVSLVYSELRAIARRHRLGEAWMLHNLARVHSKMDALDRTRDFVTAARKIAIELDNAELLNALREISN